MSASNLVIVESPAKAKTIEKYLGADYEVLASFGHVRDLVNKDGSVLPDDDFAMRWEIGDRAGKPLSDIKRALKKSTTLYLATDPDREGEAISWHVRDVLEHDGLLTGKTIKRVTFNEITKGAVKEAFSHARELDTPLIDAYLARRALDYLVGFNISPVLWRKLPGARSAGRVQSVALRLICDREAEIEKFRSQEYWSIEARLHTPDGAPFTAKLTMLSGNKIGKMDIADEAMAKAAVKRIEAKALKVQVVEKKQSRRSPYPPFITSSLQMEASRKLGFSAAHTMRIAQRLYEGVEIGGEMTGLITYMRTDGITLSQDAIMQARDLIKSKFGDKYLPDSPRMYKSKAKNAQEAHEAVRPTSLARLPDDVRKYVDPDMTKLYDLIWKRTMACQMENAILDQVAADISDGTDDVVLRATGSVIAFDGFLTLYHEDRDDEPEEGDEDNRRLPPLAQGDALKTVGVTPAQHFTQPPPRYSEASLVKVMEEKGIGRPSTYASILQVLRDRQYVTMDRKRFIPEDRGRIVTTFLIKFFGKYVDYDFTANLEEELDAIAAGHVHWKEALRQFWTDFSKAVGDTKELRITEVIDHLNEELAPHFFPETKDGSDPRACPACSAGKLSLKLGKFGAFMGCSNYPECRYTRPLVVPTQDGEGAEGEDAASAQLSNEPKILGNDPATGRTVSLRRGPYGPYVQIDPPPESKDKPKRQGLPAGTSVADVTLEVALKLLSLPREVGKHPETGDMIKAGIGRFGPFLYHKGEYTSIRKSDGDDIMSVGLNRAVVLIAEGAERKAKRGDKPARGRFAKKGKAAADKKGKPETAAKPKATKAKKAPAKKTPAKKPAAAKKKET